MQGGMMTRILIICATAFLMVSIAHAQGIDGKWKGEMQGPNGSMQLTFNFKVIGDSLTGSVEGGMGEIPITNGKVNGKTFSFDVDVNDMTISHQCTVMGDSISMKINGFQEGEPMEIILKRAPETGDESK
jgi:hypothetical protein